MPLKKPSGNGASESGPQPSSWQGSCLSVFSSLMEFLFCPCWEDSSRRQLGTLQVSYGQSLIQVKLRDLDRKAYAFFCADTLDGALLLAEEALKEGKGDWRKDEWAGKRASGK